jgi:hypothetical protein
MTDAAPAAPPAEAKRAPTPAQHFAARVQQASPLNDAAIAFLQPKAAELGFTLVHERDRPLPLPLPLSKGRLMYRPTS